MSEMRDIILKQANQIRQSIKVNKKTKADNNVDSIILAGMGGSGHPGDLLNALDLPTTPLTVHRDYDLPKTLNKTPLVINASYTGNTEEALSAYQKAKKNSYPLLVNTAGGKLKEWGKRDNVPIAKIDFADMQPRHTLFASFTGLATVLANSNLAKDITDDLLNVADALDAIIPSLEEEGKELAKKLKGKTPVYYASTRLEFAAKNFKIQTNENAKTPAFWNTFPELNHNELVGFTFPQAKFHALFLKDKDDHKRNKARMNVTKELYEEWGIEVSEFEVTGKSLLEKIFTTVSFGLWTTYYLAEEYDIDPIPVAGVEDFKAKLKEVAG